VAFDVSLPDVRYGSVDERNRFFDRVLSNVRAVPGVRSAAMVIGLPLTGESHVNGIELEGGESNPIAASKTDLILINVRFVSADYFATLGIPLLKGRVIEGQDMPRHVAVISERFAAKVWPGQNPIGKRFKTGSRVGEVEVIGVVKDVHNGSLDKDPTLIAYVPYTVRGPNNGSVVVRTDADPRAVIDFVRKAVWSVDSQIPVARFVTIAELVEESVATQRFEMRLSSAFGLSALCLAVIGVYGVVAYNVSARRTEMGIRLAIGAKPNALVASVTWRGLRPLAAGLLIGLGVAAACGWLMRSLLFEVQAVDPMTLAGVVLLLLATGSAACLIPALRVSRLNAASVLRYE
jgi:predicted permease